MTKYIATMLDETGCHFIAELEAASRSDAFDMLHDDYPESRVSALHSEQDLIDEERAFEASIWESY